MKDKKEIPWYLWRFSFGSVFIVYILGFILYKNAKGTHEIPIWINFLFSAGLIYIILWIIKSEWKHRKPHKFKINKK